MVFYHQSEHFLGYHVWVEMQLYNQMLQGMISGHLFRFLKPLLLFRHDFFNL